MSRSEFENIVKSFPGRDEGQKKRINIARFYDYKYTVLKNKIYDKVDMFNGDDNDEPVDTFGFTGQFVRTKRTLNKISTYDFIHILLKNRERLGKVWLLFRHIDNQRNGYVTNTEMDDVLKEVFPELANSDLSDLISPFSSIQSKVLVDHKLFKSKILI